MVNFWTYVLQIHTRFQDDFISPELVAREKSNDLLLVVGK